MDAVILAGGKGSRLDGVMPPYWKPLMPINGMPLINRIVDQAMGYAARVFVIVAPENALQVAQVLKGKTVFMVVQPEAKGPGDALMLGLALTKQESVLVLMGDNLMPDEDIKNVCDARRASSFVIGTAEVATVEEAARFTRIYDGGRHIEEGPNVSLLGDYAYTVWCGPLILPVDDAMDAIRTHADEGEKKIGTHLTYIARQPVLIPCSAVDIGTPASLMEVQA